MQIGTDIIEIHRIQAAYLKHEGFAKRILSQEEYQLFEAMATQRGIEFLAGRFCAKEAYSKALGTGIGRIAMKEISILWNELSAPYIAAGPIVEDVAVSISHSKEYAMAVVIISLPRETIDKKVHSYLLDKLS